MTSREQFEIARKTFSKFGADDELDFEIWQAGRQSMKDEAMLAVSDAGGDNAGYHMEAIKEIQP